MTITDIIIRRTLTVYAVSVEDARHLLVRSGEADGGVGDGHEAAAGWAGHGASSSGVQWSHPPTSPHGHAPHLGHTTTTVPSTGHTGRRNSALMSSDISSP